MRPNGEPWEANGYAGQRPSGLGLGPQCASIPLIVGVYSVYAGVFYLQLARFLTSVVQNNKVIPELE